ncbi:uncharacterized protein E0L32_012307 [Thyridium curvatum]|uniref:Beta-glucuronidase C-terminal domain-containing protein n=1 Tax=Thyridium curvatum TaxID=1093900 RepID=A0A507BK45_9PEZI|nr:uncharacterized protein E0L32_012307 [Thyridium curvatum]TPX17050.1 hypothetical protein E0L32_012307 [Thyridium curvatum]
MHSFAALTLLLALATSANGLSLTIPSTVPKDASKPVDPDFAGFAFEEASLNEYALDESGKPNQFSQDLIHEITKRTGGKALIRLGGTSADYAHYIPTQKTPVLPKAEVYNYQDVGNTTIGSSYWKLTESFPEAKWIIQLPLANPNLTESIEWARTAINTIGEDKIYAIEPGNEPDLYGRVSKPELKPPHFLGILDNETYVGNFTRNANAVAEAADLPPGRILQAFDTSVHLGRDVGAEAWVLDVEKCFGLGIDAANNIQSVAHHYYQTNGGSATTLEEGLMDHAKIASHLDLFRPAINWLAENKPQIAYIMSEIGNSLNRKHDYDYQASLGSALWQVDFQLYSLSIGVARFNFQQIMHSGFDLWLPVASGGMPPQVFSNFYAQPLVTDFVGTGGKTRVAKLADLAPNVIAYGAFVGDRAERVTIVNMNYWNRTSSGRERGGRDIDLQVPSDVKSVTLTRLTSPEGAGGKADSMTYAGSQWTFESLGKEVKGVRNDTKQLAPKDNKVTFKAMQSEVVLLHLRR